MSMVKLRKRAGNIPANATGLILDGENGWNIYRLPARDPRWINVKVMCRESIKGGANYWLGWSLDKKRLAFTADRRRLRDDHLDVYEWLVDCMTQLYPTLTEADMALPKIALDAGIEGML